MSRTSHCCLESWNLFYQRPLEKDGFAFVMLIGLPGRFVHALANTWALLARAGADTNSEYGDWNVGNIMTLNGSETQEVRLVDYAGTKELVFNFKQTPPP